MVSVIGLGGALIAADAEIEGTSSCRSDGSLGITRNGVNDDG